MPCCEAFSQFLSEPHVRCLAFARALQCKGDELFSMFEQVGAELATCSREVM